MTKNYANVILSVIMRHKILYVIISVVFCLLLCSSDVFSYWMWTPQTKRWINPKYAPKDTPKEQLLYAMDLFEAEEYRKALEEFKKVIAYYERSEAAAEAQYYIGRCHEELQNPYHAFLAYQKVIENYPFSQRIDEIIKQEYDIAERLFQGEKVKFVGMPFKATPEQAIEVYKKVVANAPYSKYAPVAQYRIGQLYKRLQFYREALEAFQRIVEDYPDSEIADDARFQVAICASSGSLSSAYDQKLTSEAIAKFEEFARKHPDSELVKEARKERSGLMEKKAKSLYEIAQFYEGRKRYKSAIIYYKDIVDNFSSTQIAPLAMEKAEVLRRKIGGK